MPADIVHIAYITIVNTGSHGYASGPVEGFLRRADLVHHFEVRVKGRKVDRDIWTQVFKNPIISMKRINRIRKVTRSSLNHVVLACLEGALRRYLVEIGHPGTP